MCLYTIFGIADSLPPQHTWFIWQRLILAAGQVLVGIGQLPFVLVLFLVRGNSLALYIVSITILALLGFLIGKSVNALWRGRRAVRLYAIFAVAGNAVLGAVTAADGTLVTEARERECFYPYRPYAGQVACERQLSTLAAFRTVVFQKKSVWASDPEYVSFCLFTLDGGRHWKQLLDDDGCRAVSRLDFVWLWSDSKVAVTRDGGATWNVWEQDMYLRSALCGLCGRPRICSVTFADKSSGGLHFCVPGLFGYQTVAEYHTDDGGRTWRARPATG
jgi:hypothetical protein